MNNRLLYIGLGSVFVVMIGLYFIQFGFYPLSDSPQNWGAFGDFLGGILNPIISFTALIILIKTIKQNEKALDQAQKALEQNEQALRQNAKELHLSTKELNRSAESQEEQAELQNKRFRHEYTESKKRNYIENIQFKVGQINSAEQSIIFRQLLGNRQEHFKSLSPSEINDSVFSFTDDFHKDDISTNLTTYSTSIISLITDLLAIKNLEDEKDLDSFLSLVVFEGFKKKMKIDEWILKLEYLKFHDVKEDRVYYAKEVFPELASKLTLLKSLQMDLDKYLVNRSLINSHKMPNQ